MFIKKLATALFFSSLTSSVVAGSTIFDLQDQNFANAIAGDMTPGVYDLGETRVSTNLNYETGHYITENDSGYFNVSLKNTIPNWGINYNATYALENYSTPQSRSVTINAENGSSIIINFSYGSTTYNGERVATFYHHQRLTVSIQKRGDTVNININGTNVGTAERPDFDKLKSVDIQLIRERDTVNTDFYDYLNSLIIGSD